MTQQLPENIVNLLVSNTEPMVNNFNKIVSWLIKGAESEHKLPPAVASFLEDYAGVKQQADETAKALATALELVEQLNKTLAEQAEQNATLKGHVADLITKVNAIEVAESKPKSRKKVETKAETVAEPEQQATAEATPPAQDVQPATPPAQDVQPASATTQDEVTLTAEAVGAGEVGTVGLGQLASMIDSILAPSGAAASSAAPVMDSL